MTVVTTQGVEQVQLIVERHQIVGVGLLVNRCSIRIADNFFHPLETYACTANRIEVIAGKSSSVFEQATTVFGETPVPKGVVPTKASTHKEPGARNIAQRVGCSSGVVQARFFIFKQHRHTYFQSKCIEVDPILATLCDGHESRFKRQSQAVVQTHPSL